MPDTHTGGCLCGEVTFRASGAARNVANCHCSVCRRSTGAAFNTVVLFRQEEFHLVTGADRLSSYALSEQATKYFCPRCGTELYHVNRHLPGLTIVPLGACNDAERLEPTLNVYCESMLPWVAAIAQLPSYPRGAKG